MKYIKIKHNPWTIVGMDKITKDDLIQIKMSVYDILIDTETGTMFDPETNSWLKITKI